MQKWEYLTVKQVRDVTVFTGSVNSWNPSLNLQNLGNDGWELVSTFFYRQVFFSHFRLSAGLCLRSACKRLLSAI